MAQENDNSGTVYVYASITREWEDFTETHKVARTTAEEAINRFVTSINRRGSDLEAPPLIIVGGLGSGKTQLLYHLFKYSWKEKGVPTLYVTLRTLINMVKMKLVSTGKTGRLNPTELIYTLSELALKKLELIKDNFSTNKYNLTDLWLPEIAGRPVNMSPSEFFKEIQMNPNVAYKIIDETLQRKQGIILVIDEVEMAYKELKDLIEGGFRDLTDIIGRNIMGIYTVMAVSYLSYYELFLSEFTGDIAFVRRVTLVQLPPIDPNTLYERLKQLNIEKKSNTFWWFTRGRLGWVASLKNVIMIDDQSVGNLLEWIKAPQLKTPIAENLPILDVEELLRFEDKYCRDDGYCKASLRFFLLNIKPCKKDSLPQFAKNKVDMLSIALMQCKELVSKDAVVDAFIRDIKEFCDKKGISLGSEHLELIERALNEVLSALTLHENGSSKLCIGAPNSYELNDFAQKYIEAVLDILMTYIAENYGGSKKAQEAIEGLYLVYSLALTKDEWREHSTFYKVKELFQSNIGTNYIVISPWILRSFIPMSPSNPIISKAPGLSLERLEQKLHQYLQSWDENSVIDAISDLSRYVCNKELESSAVPYIMVVPRGQYLDTQIYEKVYNIVKSLLKKHLYDLKNSPKKIVLFVTGGDSSFVQKIKDQLGREDVLLNLLINRIGRVSIEPIPGERLSDFVKSLFTLLADEKQETQAVAIEKVIETLRPDQKRRVEYFSSTLRTWILDTLKKLEKEREKKLYVDELRSLQNGILNDLDTLDKIAKRVQKYRSHIRAYAALFASIPFEAREPFEHMKDVLSPGSLVGIKSLPSIYQEFHLSRKARCTSIMGLLNIPTMSALVDVALEDKKAVPLEEALNILEEETLPLYEDFAEILEKTLDVRKSHWDVALRLLYRLLLLIKLLNARKDNILKLCSEQTEKVKDTADKLRALLKEVDKVSETLCQSTPVCVKIEIRPNNKTSSLKDEVDGITKALDVVKQWAEDLHSGHLTSPEHFIVAAFMTVFGLPEQKERLQDQIEEELKKWYEDVYEKIYKQLTELQQKLYQLPPKVLQDLNKQIPIYINIESIKSLDNAKDTLNDILKEVEDLVKDYNEAINKINQHVLSIRKQLENTLNKIKELEKL